MGSPVKELYPDSDDDPASVDDVGAAAMRRGGVVDTGRDESTPAAMIGRTTTPGGGH